MLIPPPAPVIRSRRLVILLTTLIAMLGLVMGCAAATARSGSPAAAPPSTAAAAPPNTIVIKNFAFEPASLTVARGTVITVINEDQAPHTVTATGTSLDSGTIVGGQRGQITAPTQPGTYPFICSIHPFMTGTLIVQ